MLSACFNFIFVFISNACALHIFHFITLHQVTLYYNNNKKKEHDERKKRVAEGAVQPAWKKKMLDQIERKYKFYVE